MMLFHTKYPCVVTGTRLNITEQEIVDVKRNFHLHPIFRDVTGPRHHVRIGLDESFGLGFAGVLPALKKLGGHNARRRWS